MGQEWVSQCPVMAYTCFMPWLSSVGRKKKSKGTSANIKWNQSPGFVCSQREVKRAILSRAANLWSYLVDKSIAVSESKPECAVRELEGLPLAWCPQGPSRGGTCLSLHPPSLPHQCSHPVTTWSHKEIHKTMYTLKRASSDILLH